VSAKDEFRDYCLELLSGMRHGEIVAKKMFGGTGFSIDGKTFGIIAFDELWLKVDDDNRAALQTAKCRIFTYAWKDGIERNLGYYSAPEEAMESAALMRPWAMLGWEAALRAAAKTKKSTKKPATTITKTLASKSIEKTIAKPATKSKKS
jgi:DNA transformation protein and related proteins